MPTSTRKRKAAEVLPENIEPQSTQAKQDEPAAPTRRKKAAEPPAPPPPPPPPPAAPEPAPAAVDETRWVQWVQCENKKCQKWRKLMNPSSTLPDKWYCKMNVDPLRNKCSAAEETWEDDDEEEESDDEAYEDLLLAKTKVAAAKAEAKAEERRKSAELPGKSEDDDGTATGGGSQLTAGQQRMLDSDGFVLLPVKQSEAPSVWVGLERLMQTDGKKLGKGKDVGSPMTYDSLKLACAWKIENSCNSDAYESGVAKVSSHMRKISTSLTGLAPPTGLPAMTAAAALAALSESNALRPDVNEQLLLHGTSPDVLFSLLSNGLNERFSGTNAGTLFGDGIYFAEDVGKSDQYVAKDEKLEVSSELHQRRGELRAPSSMMPSSATQAPSTTCSPAA